MLLVSTKSGGVNIADIMAYIHDSANVEQAAIKCRIALFFACLLCWLAEINYTAMQKLAEDTCYGIFYDEGPL